MHKYFKITSQQLLSLPRIFFIIAMLQSLNVEATDASDLSLWKMGRYVHLLALTNVFFDRDGKTLFKDIDQTLEKKESCRKLLSSKNTMWYLSAYRSWTIYPLTDSSGNDRIPPNKTGENISFEYKTKKRQKHHLTTRIIHLVFDRKKKRELINEGYNETDLCSVEEQINSQIETINSKAKSTLYTELPRLPTHSRRQLYQQYFAEHIVELAMKMEFAGSCVQIDRGNECVNVYLQIDGNYISIID